MRDNVLKYSLVNGVIKASWWLERGGTTRSHPEHGSETLQRRRY